MEPLPRRSITDFSGRKLPDVFRLQPLDGVLVLEIIYLVKMVYVLFELSVVEDVLVAIVKVVDLGPLDPPHTIQSHLGFLFDVF